MQTDFNRDDVDEFMLEKQASKAAPAEAFILYKDADVEACKTSQCILQVLRQRRKKWNAGEPFCPETDKEWHVVLQKQNKVNVVHTKDLQVLTAPSPFFTNPLLHQQSSSPLRHTAEHRGQ